MKVRTLSFYFFPILLASFIGCTQNNSVANDSGVYFVKKDGPNPNVVASFKEKQITMEDLEKSSPDIYSARLDLYKTQVSALEEYVRNSVLDELAKKANLSTDEFMKKEMELAKKKVTEKEVENFLKARNVTDTSKIPPQVRDQIRGLLHVQKLVANATSSNKVELYLKRPTAQPLNVKIEGESTWGDPNAPIKLVEFSDFQCPFCAEGKTRLNELKKLYGKKLFVVFKHFPLPMHPEARPAHEASLCVEEQNNDKFWKYHDMLFDDQKAWTKDDLMAMAKKVGVDMKQFEECFDTKKHAARVEENLAEGQKLGVNSTPTFFVNSQLIKGAQKIEEFKEIIEDSLN
ncbi:MAG: DsbA family protein [Oligoflexia bacterium]|nr:DsbA family protein [Oligoflexia bacterium]